MTAAIGLHHLVGGFRTNLKSLKDNQAPEAVIRQEYIDEFWKLLGWDVNNSEHRSLAVKDVVIEATVGTVENQKERSRRPDYLFRIDGFSRFIVEAKRPNLDITKDKDAIFQAKTYAWSAQIPFAILTNFEQFRLFDTTLKPYHKQPGKGLVADFDLRFEDYEEQWDIFCQTFGRDAVAEGSLEALLASIKKVRKGRRIRGIDRMLIDLKGSEPVDKAFLKHLEDYRLRFAKELYKENKKSFPEADTRHGAARLTEATQRLIDRIVFIRVCEDRNITAYGSLREILNHASQERLDLYSELISEFRRFNDRYNGYLFKPHFSEDMAISSDLLADFISTLYMPDAPYRFDAIGDDLLGIIYERFLGSVITIERGHVRAEEKPEVRHAGGVYYTPKFVVDTIIQKVIGPKIEGKNPEEITKIKILDPACGSGSFLISALQYLYDYCIHYFEKHPKSFVVKASPKAKTKTKNLGFKDEDGNWHLMPEFRGQLLAACIYGVDIDAQATEVTIMSLYLKMLEGKLPENWQQDFLSSRLLPSLDNNIRCGNSLISQTDFDKYWDNKFNDLFGGDEDVRFRINAFDWTSQTRGFGRILDKGKGFHCLIGNPPYIRVQELKKWEPEECEFYKENYKAATRGNYDLYVVFIEKALQLLRPDGLMGYICPHKFFNAQYGSPIRKIIAKGKHLSEVVHFGAHQVFKGATTYTCLMFLSKKANQKFKFNSIANLDDWIASGDSVSGEIATEKVDESAWNFVVGDGTELYSKLVAFPTKLGDVSSIFVGLQTSADTVFLFKDSKKSKGEASKLFSKQLQSEFDIENSLLKEVVRSGQIGRYWHNPNALILFPYEQKKGLFRLIPESTLKRLYPKTWEYLTENKTLLANREHGKFKNIGWHQLYPKNLDVWEQPKRECSSKCVNGLNDS